MNSRHPSARYRVLVVDDHAVMRASIAALVAGTPDLAVCGQAGSVAHAVRLLDSARPDLVLADLSLPTGTGFDVITAAGRHRPPIPVLVLSMHSESFNAPQAFHAGAAGYVMKGDSEPLLAGIRQVRAGGIVLSPHVRREILHRWSGDPGAGFRPPLPRLSKIERTVLALHGRRLTLRAIASQVGETPAQIRRRLATLGRKLQLPHPAALRHHAVLWQEMTAAVEP